MTTYQIVISGEYGTYDITSRTMSATWNRSLGDSASTLDIVCKNLTQNHVMGTVTLTVNGTVCFTGTVKSQSEDSTGILKTSSLKCVDRTDVLQRLMIAETFTNQKPKQILQTLRNKYATWLDVSGVRDVGGVLDSLTFNYETFSSAIEKLAEITGAYWYIDASNKLRFFLDNQGISAYEFGPDRILEGSFGIDTTALDLVNRIWVIGARQSSPTAIEQTFFGDNSNEYFLLAYEPNYPKVYENGVLKTIELEDGEVSTKDFSYNKKFKVLRRNGGPLSAGSNIKIVYNPTVQVIDYFEDTDSVARYGLYEKAIRDQKITDKMAARSRGRAELKKKKRLINRASWSTRTWQVNPGELAKVTLGPFALDRYFRIESVDVDFSPEDVVASISAEEVEQ
jgi:hypothetical protein